MQYNAAPVHSQVPRLRTELGKKRGVLNDGRDGFENKVSQALRLRIKAGIVQNRGFACTGSDLLLKYRACASKIWGVGIAVGNPA